MKRCESCKVNIDSPVDACPLCFSTLVQVDNMPERGLYPMPSAKMQQWSIIKRALLMLSIAISVIGLTLNILTYSKLWWSLIVIGNIVYMWFAIRTVQRKRQRIGYNMFLQVLSLAIFVTAASAILGWEVLALNYLLPLLFIAAMISITVVTIVKRADARNLILYFFLISLLGLIPIIPFMLGISTVLWPSLASAIYAGLSLVGLFVFAQRSTSQELTKRFHI